MSTRRVSPWKAICVLGLLALAMVGPLSAQEVQWRYDYNAARREARETHRPIVMDFGTAHCFWCQKLDAVTFHDPAVIKQLNEQFIPIKIAGEKAPGLTEFLHIDSFPALVFAAPDGKILGIHDGFVDAARFRLQLRHALGDSVPKFRAQSP